MVYSVARTFWVIKNPLDPFLDRADTFFALIYVVGFFGYFALLADKKRYKVR